MHDRPISQGSACNVSDFDNLTSHVDAYPRRLGLQCSRQRQSCTIGALCTLARLRITIATVILCGAVIMQPASAQRTDGTVPLTTPVLGAPAIPTVASPLESDTRSATTYPLDDPSVHNAPTLAATASPRGPLASLEYGVRRPLETSPLASVHDAPVAREPVPREPIVARPADGMRHVSAPSVRCAPSMHCAQRADGAVGEPIHTAPTTTHKNRQDSRDNPNECAGSVDWTPCMISTDVCGLHHCIDGRCIIPCIGNTEYFQHADQKFEQASQIIRLCGPWDAMPGTAAAAVVAAGPRIGSAIIAVIAATSVVVAGMFTAAGFFIQQVCARAIHARIRHRALRGIIL